MAGENDSKETASNAGNTTGTPSNTGVSTSNDTNPIINRVAVKVPPFWPDHAEIWLAQVEAQFSIAGITGDASKYNTVVAAIESNVLVQISDAILNPPHDDKYENLKKCILERYCESEQKKTQKLLSEIDLGDKRPTQLLNELSALAKDKVTRDFLKTLWLQRLPAQVRAILQASDADLNELAKLADKIMEVGEFQHLAVVSSTQSHPAGVSEIDKRLERLERQINSLCESNTNYRRRSRSVSSKRQKNTQQQDASNQSRGQLCWYHEKYGESARKCREPCTYKKPEKN